MVHELCIRKFQVHEPRFGSYEPVSMCTLFVNCCNMVKILAVLDVQKPHLCYSRLFGFWSKVAVSVRTD